jgi:hypothetical protein
MGRLRSAIRQAAREERAKRVHRSSFEGKYNQTPQQMHADLAFPKNAKCECGRKPIVRAITMAPFADAQKQWPEIAAMDPGVLMQRIIQIKENPFDKEGSPYVRIGKNYSCESCRPALERALAQLPSWVLVEFNEPPSTRKVVGLS